MAKKAQSTEKVVEEAQSLDTPSEVSSPSEEVTEAKNEAQDTVSVQDSPELAQFPALVGEPAVEIEERSPDGDGSQDMRFRKSFVVLGHEFEGDPTFHERNKLVVLQEAIQRGVHPQGEATFDGQTDLADGQSVQLDYSVASIPAVTDEDPADTVTPRKVLVEKLDGSTDNA